MTARFFKPTRRAVLKTGLPLILALHDTARAKSAGNKRVVVVGAGLAGLSAARELARRKIDVTVVEARHRIGGRIWTSRAWPGMPMDLGASWIHGVDGNPLTRIAKEAGAKRLATSYDSAVAYDATGRSVDIEPGMTKARSTIEAAIKAAETAERDTPLGEAIQASRGWATADAAARRMIRHAVNASVEQEYGGDWMDVSTWYYDEQKQFGGSDELFPLGFDQITNWLARGLNISLGTAVTAIAPMGGSIGITFSNGQRLQADHVIVSVPLGVLKAGRVSFGAALDPKRQRAIEMLRMGLLNKCWLRFDRIAWPGNVDWIEWLGPQDGAWAQWVSLAHRAKIPVLLGFHAGEQARHLETSDDAGTMAAAHESLKAMFGTAFPAPRAALITRWSIDPFALGSYSFNAVGVTPKTRKDLAGADWDGRLIFAGEAASTDYFGTAHGAVLSGLAAANAVLD